MVLQKNTLKFQVSNIKNEGKKNFVDWNCTKLKTAPISMSNWSPRIVDFTAERNPKLHRFIPNISAGFDKFQDQTGSTYKDGLPFVGQLHATVIAQFI